jgi:hypothetical protein
MILYNVIADVALTWLVRFVFTDIATLSRLPIAAPLGASCVAAGIRVCACRVGDAFYREHIGGIAKSTERASTQCGQYVFAFNLWLLICGGRQQSPGHLPARATLRPSNRRGAYLRLIWICGAEL